MMQTAHATDVDVASPQRPRGTALYGFVEQLYPICRSITGDGLRRTLALVQERLPDLEVHEVPTGTRVFDWTIPKEWNVRDAYVKNSSGARVIDFHRSNLHVVGYSAPVSTRLRLDELKPHLHTLPEHPDWIPFHTSYSQETWGFCLSHRQLLALADDEYEVRVDSTLEPGSLTYGELLVRGSSADEVLLSCHCCHPSLCNDNLSGVSVAVALARYLSDRPNRYSYRFLFVPATFGSIAWLARNEDSLDRIKAGLTLSCVGDAGPFTYKRSRRGDTRIDRAAAHVLKHLARPFTIEDFVPFGYDERQYCSPGFDLPVGSLLRTPNGRFPQYHTSADDLSFVTPEALEDSFDCCLAILDACEVDRTYVNLNPRCEPQLGRRGLYRSMGPGTPGVAQMALLWVLSYSDGRHSLLDIAERSNIPITELHHAALALEAAQLLRE